MEYKAYSAGGRWYADGSGDGPVKLNDLLERINQSGAKIVSVFEVNGLVTIIVLGD